MAHSIANIVFPGSFDPKTDKWSEYKEQLLFSLQAAGVENDIQKARALFLSQCGKETYSLVSSLLVPKKPADVEFNQIIATLDSFFEPKVHEILQASKFYHRDQRPGESIQCYISAIKVMAAPCNFTDLERMLRDRLVLGIRDQRLRRDLLKDRRLTFNTAVQQALDYEGSNQEIHPPAYETRGEIDTEPMEVNTIQKTVCRHCGNKHASGACKFRKSTCFYCKKVGHVVAVCKSAKERKVLAVNEDVSGSEVEQEELNTIYSVLEPRTEPFVIDLLVNSAKVSMEIDSGAARSIISEATYRMLGNPPPPLTPVQLKLVTWTREKLNLKGLLQVNVSRVGDHSVKLPLLVAYGEGPNLVGRDWFPKLGIEIEGVGWTDDNIQHLITQFPHVFKDGLGQYTGPAISLAIKESATPRFLKSRPIPFPLREQVNAELGRLMDAGVLTQVSFSDWATPMRIVKKDNGSLRICGDYRSTVNAAIDVDTYPLPTSSEAFQLLSGGKIFTKLDLREAYTQVHVTEETARMLTLNTPRGLMRVNRLAFGVSAAPGIFQRLMATTFADMKGVAILLDDIVVAGATESEHAHRLQDVLSKISKLGFTLNKDKCQFATHQVTFLGFVLNGQGIHPCPEKIREIKEKATPTNITELRAFLGLYNFYERFFKEKATVMEPLYKLLNAKIMWKWGRPEQVAFQRAKELLVSERALVHYELKRELLVITDASEYGLGAILAHRMDDGSERPVMMSSRTMQPHERRYSQLDKEALAIMFAVRKFHQYLAGRNFVVFTDHKPLVGLLNPAKAIPEQISPRLLRWSLTLGSYNYSIKYRSGAELQNADGLSRWSTLEPAQDETLPKEVLLLGDETQEWSVSAVEVAKETKVDPVLSQVMYRVLHGWSAHNDDADLQPYWLRRDALSVSKDCLLWSNRVIIPNSLRKIVLKFLHIPHAGISQTKAYARGYVWWPGLDAQIEKTVELCVACQLTRNNPSQRTQPWPVADKPWSRVHIDFAGPFLGKTFLVLVDSFSKWPEIEIMTSMNSAQVIQKLRLIFASQGLPEVLVSDNGLAFTSKEFKVFLERNRIKHLTSPPYHPASNGQIERTIQTIKNRLKRQGEMPWPERVAKVLFHLRTVPSSVTDKSPAELLNNRKFRTALSNLHPYSLPAPSQSQQERTVESEDKGKHLEIGQAVWARAHGTNKKWEPAIVKIAEGKVIYVVCGPDGEQYRRHIDQLRPRIIKDASQDVDIAIPNPDEWGGIIGIPEESNL